MDPLPVCRPGEEAEFFAEMETSRILLYLSHPDDYMKSGARCEIDRRILAHPHIIDDQEGRGLPGQCAWCGWGVYRKNVETLSRHFTEAGHCAGGFTPDLTCIYCKEQCESVHQAMKHRVRMDHPGAIRRIQEAHQREVERLKAIYCEACSHQSATKKDFAKHCLTKAHHKATHPDEFLCVPCGHRSRCATEHQAHLESKGHRKVVEAPSLTCEPCGVVCRGKYEYDRHCEGKQHIYKTTPSARPKLTCDLCGITRPSQAQYQVHLQTAKHRKKEAEQQGRTSLLGEVCPEDPVSPDDAKGCPDTR